MNDDKPDYIEGLSRPIPAGSKKPDEDFKRIHKKAENRPRKYDEYSLGDLELLIAAAEEYPNSPSADYHGVETLKSILKIVRSDEDDYRRLIEKVEDNQLRADIISIIELLIYDTRLLCNFINPSPPLIKIVKQEDSNTMRAGSRKKILRRREIIASNLWKDMLAIEKPEDYAHIAKVAKLFEAKIHGLLAIDAIEHKRAGRGTKKDKVAIPETPDYQTLARDIHYIVFVREMLKSKFGDRLVAEVKYVGSIIDSLHKEIKISWPTTAPEGATWFSANIDQYLPPIEWVLSEISRIKSTSQNLKK